MGILIEVWRGRIGSFYGHRWKFSGHRCDVSWNSYIAVSLIMILLVIGNIEWNLGPVPRCKFPSCTVVPETIAASVRHQHYHGFGSNFMYYCPALECPYLTKSFNALNHHVSTFHREIRHHNFSEANLSNIFSCTICSNCYSSLWDVVQHLCYHMDEENLILPKCPIAHDSCSEASFKKGSTFRTHLSQYHPEWRTEGCPIKFILPKETDTPPPVITLEDNCEPEHLNIDPLSQFHETHHQTVTESLILDIIGKFYRQLYAEFCIPYSNIQDICNSIILISELNNKRIIQQLKAGLDHLGVAADEVNNLCHNMSKADILFTSHHKSASAAGQWFVTDYFWKKYFKDHYNFKEPLKVRSASASI